MAQELIYTSAPKGLREGSSGFCVVAYTRGMPANLVQLLESLSAYKPVFPHYDKNANLNPVSYSHYKTSIGSTPIHILSRICFAGLDYSKRSNKLAHHLVFDVQERIKCGPAVVFRVPELFLSKWESDPGIIEQQKRLGEYEWPLRKAATWEQVTGDAGWAAVLADSFVKTPDKTAFIIFDPNCNVDTLSLVDEALMLLRPEDRWQVSFNTYFTSLPPSVQCNWRFCVPDSDALKEARRQPGALIIDLTKPMERAPDGLLAERARTGEEKIPKILSSITGAKLDHEAMNLDEPERKKMPSLQMPSPQMQPYRKPAIAPARTRTPARILEPINQANQSADENTLTYKLTIATIIIATIAVVIFLFFHITGSNKSSETASSDNLKDISVNKDTGNTSNLPQDKAEPESRSVGIVPYGQTLEAKKPETKTTQSPSTSATKPTANDPPPQPPANLTNKPPLAIIDNKAELLRLTFWKRWTEQMKKLDSTKILNATINPQSPEPLKINIPLELSGDAKIEVKLKSSPAFAILKNNNSIKVIGQINIVSGISSKYEDAFYFSVNNGCLVIEKVPPYGTLENQLKLLKSFTDDIEQYVINGKSYYPNFTPSCSYPLEIGKGSFIVKENALKMAYKLTAEDKLANWSQLPDLFPNSEGYIFKVNEFSDTTFSCSLTSKAINDKMESLNKVNKKIENCEKEIDKVLWQIIKNLEGKPYFLLLTADAGDKTKLNKAVEVFNKSTNDKIKDDKFEEIKKVIELHFKKPRDKSKIELEKEMNALDLKIKNLGTGAVDIMNKKELTKKSSDIKININEQTNFEFEINRLRQEILSKPPFDTEMKQIELIKTIKKNKIKDLNGISEPNKKKLKPLIEDLESVQRETSEHKTKAEGELKIAKDKLLSEKEILVKMSKKIKNDEGQEADQLVKEITFKKE